jgi:hypothetical protein
LDTLPFCQFSDDYSVKAFNYFPVALAWLHY